MKQYLFNVLRALFLITLFCSSYFIGWGQDCKPPFSDGQLCVSLDEDIGVFTFDPDFKIGSGTMTIEKVDNDNLEGPPINFMAQYEGITTIFDMSYFDPSKGYVNNNNQNYFIRNYTVVVTIPGCSEQRIPLKVVYRRSQLKINFVNNTGESGFREYFQVNNTLLSTTILLCPGSDPEDYILAYDGVGIARSDQDPLSFFWGISTTPNQNNNPAEYTSIDDLRQSRSNILGKLLFTDPNVPSGPLSQRCVQDIVPLQSNIQALYITLKDMTGCSVTRAFQFQWHNPTIYPPASCKISCEKDANPAVIATVDVQCDDTGLGMSPQSSYYFELINSQTNTIVRTIQGTLGNPNPVSYPGLNEIQKWSGTEYLIVFDNIPPNVIYRISGGFDFRRNNGTDPLSCGALYDRIGHSGSNEITSFVSYDVSSKIIQPNCNRSTGTIGAQLLPNRVDAILPFRIEYEIQKKINGVYKNFGSPPVLIDFANNTFDVPLFTDLEPNDYNLKVKYRSGCTHPYLPDPFHTGLECTYDYNFVISPVSCPDAPTLIDSDVNTAGAELKVSYVPNPAYRYQVAIRSYDQNGNNPGNWLFIDYPGVNGVGGNLTDLIPCRKYDVKLIQYCCSTLFDPKKESEIVHRNSGFSAPSVSNVSLAACKGTQFTYCPTTDITESVRWANDATYETFIQQGTPAARDFDAGLRCISTVLSANKIYYVERESNDGCIIRQTITVTANEPAGESTLTASAFGVCNDTDPITWTLSVPPSVTILGWYRNTGNGDVLISNVTGLTHTETGIQTSITMKVKIRSSCGETEVVSLPVSKGNNDDISSVPDCNTSTVIFTSKFRFKVYNPQSETWTTSSAIIGITETAVVPFTQNGTFVYQVVHPNALPACTTDVSVVVNCTTQCVAPTNITASVVSVTLQSANIQVKFNPVADASVRYEIEVFENGNWVSKGTNLTANEIVTAHYSPGNCSVKVRARALCVSPKGTSAYIETNPIDISNTACVAAPLTNTSISNITATSVTVTWPMTPGISYNVAWKLSNDIGYNVTGNVQSGYTLNNLESCTPYDIYIISNCACSKMVESVVVHCTTSADVSNINLVASRVGNNVEVNWAPFGNQVYKVSVSRNGGQYSNPVVVNNDALPYKIANITCGSLKAKVDVSCPISGVITSREVTFTDTETPCLLPTNITVTRNSNDRIIVRWTPVPNQTGSQTITVLNSSVLPAVMPSTANNISLVVPCLSNLFVQIEVECCPGVKGVTVPVSVPICSTSTITCPSSLKATPNCITTGGTGLLLTWDSQPFVNSYRIRWRKKGETTFQSTCIGNVTTFNLINLQYGTTYDYEVTPYSTNDCSGDRICTIYSATTLSTCGNEGSLCSQIISSTKSICGSTTFSWNKPSGVNCVKLRVRKKGNVNWDDLNLNGTGQTLNTLLPSTEYEYQVIPYTDCKQMGNIPSDCPVKTFTTVSCTPCTAPGFVNVNISQPTNIANVNWAAVPGATGYRIVITLRPNTVVATQFVTGNNSLSYSFPNLSAGNYQVQVCSMNNEIVCTACRGALFTIVGNGKPCPCTYFISTRFESVFEIIKIQWDPIPNVTKYVVMYSTDNIHWSSYIVENMLTAEIPFEKSAGGVYYKVLVEGALPNDIPNCGARYYKGTLCTTNNVFDISNIRENGVNLYWTYRTGITKVKVSYRKINRPLA